MKNLIYTWCWFLVGGKSGVVFLLLARRPFETGDIIRSVGLVYLPRKWKKSEFNVNTIARYLNNLHKKRIYYQKSWYLSGYLNGLGTLRRSGVLVLRISVAEIGEFGWFWGGVWWPEGLFSEGNVVFGDVSIIFSIDCCWWWAFQKNC